MSVSALSSRMKSHDGSVPRRAQPDRCPVGRSISEPGSDHSGWYPDRKIRLYDRRRGRWTGDFVHEALQVDGPIFGFTADLLHFPYRDWTDHLGRIDRYTELAAQAARKSGRRGNILRLLFGPPLSFLKTFVVRAGFMDGWRGVLIAAAGARYVFLREFRILR